MARHGDGWLPLTFNVQETRNSIEDIHARMRALGRDPAALEISLFFLDDEIRSQTAIDEAGDLGAHRAILRLPVADEAAVLKTLDHDAQFL
ncbi:MAG: hypothetical protein ACU85U_16750 [Gammaproteobacteria bacterium]